MEYNYNNAWESVYGDIQQYGATHKHLRRIVSNILRDINYKSFVDVGCGIGANTSLLSKDKNISRMVGIDISDKALNEARKKYNAEFTLMDIQKDCLDEKFDLVFCSLLLEHVLDDQIVLGHLYKMTGHYLLLATIGGNYERYRKWDEKMGHVRNYIMPELESKLNKAGFKVIKNIQWGFPFFSPIGRLLQNIRPEMGIGKYGLVAKTISNIMYWLGYLNSSKRGDLLVVLAEVDD